MWTPETYELFCAADARSHDSPETGRMARRSTARRSAAAVLTSCLALTGCAVDRGGATDATSAVPRPVTFREADLLHRAEQTLVSRCMARHGIRYWVTLRLPESWTARFRYVVDDPSWAHQHGYGADLDRRSATLGRADPNRRYFASLSPARKRLALRALNGARPEGLQARLPSGVRLSRSDSSCTSRAQRSLYGDVARWFRASTVVQGLTAIRVGRVTADRAFIRATRRWAACMRAKSHPYASPFEARDAATRSTAPRHSLTERRTAVAEATCARVTGLSATARRLDRVHALDLQHAYRSEVAAERGMQLAALPRARSVIAAGAG